MDRVRAKEVSYCCDKMSSAEVKCGLAATSAAELDKCSK